MDLRRVLIGRSLGRNLAGAAVALLAAATVWLWPTDARRVRARLLTAAEALSARRGESDVERLARLSGFARSLAPDVVLDGAVIWIELVKAGDDWLIARASTEPALAR